METEITPKESTCLVQLINSSKTCDIQLSWLCGYFYVVTIHNNNCHSAVI
jgi:hypothetical protein